MSERRDQSQFRTITLTNETERRKIGSGEKNTSSREMQGEVDVKFIDLDNLPTSQVSVNDGSVVGRHLERVIISYPDTVVITGLKQYDQD